VKLRLAIVTEIIAPYRIPVFNALTRRDDIDLHVIFLAETDQTQRQWRVYKEEIRFSYQVLPSWRRRWGKYHCLLNWGMGAALTRFSPDAILCGGYNYIASWAALRWARQQRVPLLLWVESTAKDQRGGHRFVESLKTWFINRCKGFVVPGKSSFQYLRDCGVQGETIFIAPNAVDVELFARSAEDARSHAPMHRQNLNLPRHFFLFAGRLVPEKGVFDLFQAYMSQAEEVRSEWGLVYLGSGAASAELKTRAAGLKTGSIRFPGFAQREQLAIYYGLADIFVFPTRSDPWGLVVNEAMACKLPVIASNAAGCTEDLVQDGWNGHTFAACDVEQLAMLMEKLASNEKQRREMATRSYERIQQYSPEFCADGIALAAFALRNPR